MKTINYPSYVPEWYNPEISYAIMLIYGDKSKELERYMKTGKYDEILSI